MFRLDHLYQWSPWFFCWLSLSCCDNVWGLFWGLFVGLLKFWSNMGSETCETGLELGNVVGLGPRDNELCWVRGEVLVKLTGLLCCCWLVVAWLLWCWLWSWPWTCPWSTRRRRSTVASSTSPPKTGNFGIFFFSQISSFILKNS